MFLCLIYFACYEFYFLVTFQPRDLVHNNRPFFGQFNNWTGPNSRGFGPHVLPPKYPLRNPMPPLCSIPPDPYAHTRMAPQEPGRHSRSARKNRGGFIRWRSRFRRKLKNTEKSKVCLNPSDPLNLQDLVKETERRRVEGLSPLRGDSKFNTPAVSVAGDMSEENSGVSLVDATSRLNGLQASNWTESHHQFKRRRGRFLPINGNYRDYYHRRPLQDRLKYFMPEWFTDKDVADYGCHNGTFTFAILEKFRDVHHIDAIDSDSELIANARGMLRERLRWSTGTRIPYGKINFMVANWIENHTSPVDEPQYDTILAFSVTKWIHLNYGDAGLMRFFRRAFAMLKPGGHLIVEPQPKSSYRRKIFTVCCTFHIIISLIAPTADDLQVFENRPMSLGAVVVGTGIFLFRYNSVASFQQPV